MTKADDYRRTLATLDGWEPFLLAESGLPGPRGNIELAQAVADVGTKRQFDRFLTWNADRAPVGSREEFLAFCGTVGLGRLAAERNTKVLPRLRRLASDPRWRVREGVAMALQRLGAADMRKLLSEMRRWATGNDYERRAAAAALCEPVLLKREEDVRDTLAILDQITADLARSVDLRSDGFRALRKGLAYCWSVAVAAGPEAGRPLMERWMRSGDPDVRWVMKQNLSKKRLAVVGPDWVAEWKARLDQP
jgi:HEAT repeat protein